MSTDETRLFLEAKAKLQAQEPQPAATPSSRRKAKNDAPSATPVQECVPVLAPHVAPHVARPSVGTPHVAEPLTQVSQPILDMDALHEVIRAAFQAQQATFTEQLACVREELQQIIHTQLHDTLRLLTEASQVQADGEGADDEEDEDADADEEGQLPRPTSGTRESMRSHPKPLLLGGDMKLPVSTPAPVRQRRWEPA